MTATKASKPRKATPKPDRETIPLAGVSITVTPPDPFAQPADIKPVTFEGEALAGALRWVAMTCPNLEYFTSPRGVGFELVGIADHCRAISDAGSLESSLWTSMADRLRDLAYRILAADAEGQRIEGDTVTITRKANGSGAEEAS
jgi:hypothetical protein